MYNYFRVFLKPILEFVIFKFILFFCLILSSVGLLIQLIITAPPLTSVIFSSAIASGLRSVFASNHFIVELFFCFYFGLINKVLLFSYLFFIIVECELVVYICIVSFVGIQEEVTKSKKLFFELLMLTYLKLVILLQ